MTNSLRSSKDSDYAEPPHGRSPADRSPAEAMRHNPSFGIMCHLVVKGVVVILLAVECGGCRDADDIIPRRVAGGKSRMVNRTELGVFNDGSRPFVRLCHALARRDRRRLDALCLIEIKNIRPPDKRYARGPAVLARHQVSGFVPLFEDLIINDRRGFLALLHVPAKVEGLFETDPERGLIVRGAKKQGVDSAVRFAGDDVLDGEPGLLPGHGSAFQLLDKALGDRFMDVAFHNATSRRAASMAASASSCVSWNRRAMTLESDSPSCVRVNSGVSSAPMFRSM